MLEFVHNPHGSTRIGDHIRRALTSGEWSHLHAAIAFVKVSGTEHLAAGLAGFGERGGVTRIAVGVDAQGSSYEGLRMLIDNQRGDSRLTVVHNENDSTFHPKLWLFENSHARELLVGSGNLTGGGFFTNYETLIRIRFDDDEYEGATIFRTAREVLESWTTPDKELVRELTPTLLLELVRRGYVLTEEAQRARRRRDADEHRRAVHEGSAPRLFVAVGVPPAPRLERRRARNANLGGSVAPTSTGSVQPGFVMTLHQGDVGYGQTSKRKKTSARSPEVFIPLAARDHWPEFWGWPTEFSEDEGKPGKFDRRNVPMRLGDSTILVNIMTWPDKSDFRLRSGELRRAAKVGDILRIEGKQGPGEHEYYVEVIPPGTALFAEFDALCTEKVRNSKKRWGYYELGA